ncbi:MAG TPA: DNA-3-methyladenine glycosylase [Abditibacteriaceae bacterium]|jgi:DNA-3-methyladenine glycosylase
MKFEPLPAAFFAADTVVASQELLGHFLLRKLDGEWCGGEIVETEAYISDDPACHAYVRETPRNRSMWGAAGRAYVYRIYGMHFCFNAVCRETGVAEAALVRAIEPRFGTGAMQKRRAMTGKNLTNGPAKFCQALGIDLALDGADLASPDSPLLLARNPERDKFVAARAPLVTTTRIGITRAADWPLRWYLGGSDYVSRRAPKTAV